MTTGHGPDLLDDAPAAAPADELALIRRACDLALSMPGPGSLGLMPYIPRDGSMRVFGATPGQVRAVRQLVRQYLAGHPATADAVIVASELVTNSIVHSRSSRPGGQFLVHAAVTDEKKAALIVTDQGGPFHPGRTFPGSGNESGRGLVVVRSLTSLFRICDHGNSHRSFIAVIATVPDTSEPARQAAPVWGGQR
jgi:anti-sigma regulatory factor (Ser/Thr protein kinase)